MNLAPYTTFGVEANCTTFIEVHTVAELQEALKEYPSARILGGGSNVLITKVIDEAVIKISIDGITEEEGRVTVGAGVIWHDLVTWAVEQDLGGIENLALIPGTVGAAPMQNIGAYGVEQVECFVELEAVNRSTGETRTFSKDECEFGYRTSVFKTSLRDQFVITSVTYQLETTANKLNISYKDVAQRLSEHHAPLTIKDVYDVVVEIRRNKLPDPEEIGNAGSFFKNPVVSADKAQSLMAENAGMPNYEQADGTVKVPAAWLIDQCGWKGHRNGDAGVHTKQALVLVNHGNATGSQLLDLADRIQTSVNDRFGITLEREVNVW